MEFIVASSNKQKCREFQEMAPSLNISISGSIDANENGVTYEQNALIKVQALEANLKLKGVDLKNLVLFSDDSGLEIPAMPTELGLHTARFMQGSPQAEKNKAIVERVRGQKDKSARFVCTICYIAGGTEPRFARGVINGTVADKIITADDFFNYDPVFVPQGYNITFAELGDDIKNKCSHRATAFYKMLADLGIKH